MQLYDLERFGFQQLKSAHPPNISDEVRVPVFAHAQEARVGITTDNLPLTTWQSACS